MGKGVTVSCGPWALGGKLGENLEFLAEPTARGSWLTAAVGLVSAPVDPEDSDAGEVVFVGVEDGDVITGPRRAPQSFERGGDSAEIDSSRIEHVEMVALACGLADLNPRVPRAIERNAAPER